MDKLSEDLDNSETRRRKVVIQTRHGDGTYFGMWGFGDSSNVVAVISFEKSRKHT